jgi:hypothetical protein
LAVEGLGRGAEGREVVHYFDQEADARRMLRRMLDTVEPQRSNWAQMTGYKSCPQ